MEAHAVSEIHIRSCEAEMAAARALQEQSIVQQLQRIRDQEKPENGSATKALIRFDELVDFVVSCGDEDLRRFVEKAGKNANYTSKVAVVEFVEAFGL